MGVKFSWTDATAAANLYGGKALRVKGELKYDPQPSGVSFRKMYPFFFHGSVVRYCHCRYAAQRHVWRGPAGLDPVAHAFHRRDSAGHHFDAAASIRRVLAPSSILRLFSTCQGCARSALRVAPRDFECVAILPHHAQGRVGRFAPGYRNTDSIHDMASAGRGARAHQHLRGLAAGNGAAQGDQAARARICVRPEHARVPSLAQSV
ncbi:hypothetical protein AMAG_05176 [Allomyces macrogynus ATCC 38327]|uniref:Uncharacterized protein n=1 Tax=Allomyces macrogynus (strain ATCC 38327) TaxID=578462 RepID=A0A0L0SB45_ALLM3|nr:hypothetical protein AMAG_05176 [Allomyces macrogynus ATCC 38327]|eukprot:KNE59711.1 hypothetical protein AMAG_05176 [Allomyces macrogynus ATCC 38327]